MSELISTSVYHPLLGLRAISGTEPLNQQYHNLNFDLHESFEVTHET